jgi:hypothetical protein
MPYIRRASKLNQLQKTLEGIPLSLKTVNSNPPKGNLNDSIERPSHSVCNHVLGWYSFMRSDQSAM